MAFASAEPPSPVGSAINMQSRNADRRSSRSDGEDDTRYTIESAVHDLAADVHHQWMG
jgi:hypothetical protein